MKPFGLTGLGLSRRILAGIAALAIGGCSSSSSSVIPAVVPALGSAAAQENTYTGVLVHVRQGAGPTVGWRIRNATTADTSVPVDVSSVVATARSLNGQKVTVTAHSAAQVGGRMVLHIDSLAAAD
jgi:hypothetical protein